MLQSYGATHGTRTPFRRENMKVHIDRDGCISCGTCEAICPQVFHVADDTKSAVVEKYKTSGLGEGEVPGDLVTCSQSARDACPVQVISTE